MEKIKNIWRKHKKKIVIGVLIGGTLVFIFRRKSIRNSKLPMATDDLQWVFDNLDDAVAKFRGLEVANTALEMGKEVNMTTNAGEYTVIFS